MITESFNKAMDAWTIRQLEGANQAKSTAEGSIRSIDKLQVLLTPRPLTMTDRGDYWDTPLPTDYLEWSRVSTNGIAQCCPSRKFKVYLGEEADMDFDLADKNRQPSFEWGETLGSVINNTVRIYTNGCFNVDAPSLTYYRKPRHIQIAGCANPDTGDTGVPVDILCEFPDNIIETIIDEAAAILADDMDNYNKMQALNANAERSN